MTIDVRIRVVAEIYRGIDFPDDWVAHSTDITAAMGKELVVSVIALLDAERQPVAICWQVADHDEQFARSRFDDSVDADVLDGLERDLVRLAQQINLPSELLSTFLWDPKRVPRNQAESIFKEVFARSKYSATFEWNKAPREIFASANDLIVMVRSIDDGLAEPLPATLDEIHKISDVNGAETFLILPVRPESFAKKPAEPAGGPFKTLLFAAAVLIGIALISAYLAGDI